MTPPRLISPAATRPSMGTIQRWEEKHVYTLVRESLPAWRAELGELEKEEDPWQQHARASVLRDRLNGEIAPSSKKFRLARTYEIAEQAESRLRDIIPSADALVAKGEEGIRARALEAKDQYLEGQSQKNRLSAEIHKLASEMGIEPRLSIGRSLSERSKAAKKRVFDGGLLPSRDDLDLLAERTKKKSDIYIAEHERLLKGQPLAFELANLGSSLSTIEEFLSETTYNKKALTKSNKEFKETAKILQSEARSALMKGQAQDFPGLIKALKTFHRGLQTFGEEVEEARERSQKGPSSSSSVRTVVWKHTGSKARISQRAWDAFVTAGCSPDNIRKALDTLIPGAGAGAWNLIKTLTGVANTYELKVAGSGALRAEGKVGALGQIEFITTRKGRGK
jgi:hypothetical protein